MRRLVALFLVLILATPTRANQVRRGRGNAAQRQVQHQRQVQQDPQRNVRRVQPQRQFQNHQNHQNPQRNVRRNNALANGY